MIRPRSVRVISRRQDNCQVFTAANSTTPRGQVQIGRREFEKYINYLRRHPRLKYTNLFTDSIFHFARFLLTSHYTDPKGEYIDGDTNLTNQLINILISIIITTLKVFAKTFKSFVQHYQRKNK